MHARGTLVYDPRILAWVKVIFLSCQFSCIPNICFEPAVLEEVFKLLETKVAHMKPQERKSVLLLDEMELVEKFEYDTSTSCIRDYVSMSVPGALPSQPPPASQPSLRTVSGPEAPFIKPPSVTRSSTSSVPGQTAVPVPQEPHPEPPSATHALVFMIAGVSSRWKQVICYHYTGKSCLHALMSCF